MGDEGCTVTGIYVNKFTSKRGRIAVGFCVAGTAESKSLVSTAADSGVFCSALLSVLSCSAQNFASQSLVFGGRSGGNLRLLLRRACVYLSLNII